MSLNNWKGNEKLIERITAGLREGRASHAYIIEGDTCVDKEKFARDFMKAVCCSIMPGEGCNDCVTCRKIDHDNCEDLYYVRAEGTTVKSVKDDGISELQENLKKKPSGIRNMAIICDADTMTKRAQNRLLKTLEEPYPGTVILLLSENRENLLDTIKSRCVFYRLSGDDSDEKERMVDADKLLDALIEGEKFFILKQILSKSVKNREDAFRMLDGLQRLYRNLLLEKDPRSRFVKKEDIFRAVSFIEEARRDLLMNVNYNYALKNLVLKIGG
ncbi:MAG: DNA polymerase III subunit [Firmicutes bacterium]|nr:DNA polymerase III subunit [Bacillota bacterium]